ncbi:hypothetical protein KI387_007033, partial [Taxus chinensis]
MIAKGLIDGITQALIPGKHGDGNSFEIKGEVVVEKANLIVVNDVTATVVDGLFEVLGQSVFLQLVSSDQMDLGKDMGKKSERAQILWDPLDPLAPSEKRSPITFKWKSELGIPGALLVLNTHPREFFLKSVTLFAVPGKLPELRFHCNSWIYPSFDRVERVFFSTQSHLPDKTPEGLKQLRSRELVSLRGNGTGERNRSDRIYDYDIYNDLHSPDNNADRREVLGGSQDYPYPRRCRTGRAAAAKDRKFESRPLLAAITQFFIPPDEKFPHTKLSGMAANLVKSLAQNLVPTLMNIGSDNYSSLEDVNAIYSDGIPLPFDIAMNLAQGVVQLDITKGLLDTDDKALLRFRTPQVFESEERAWKTDEEFARQALSGINPMTIKCLQSFPPSSTLDSELYGPQKSSITAEYIEKYLHGFSVQQAVKAKRLFVLDYYDAYMPYLERINKQSDNIKMYASRTLFFLTAEGILSPVAIELCLPHTSVSQAVRNVYTPAQMGEEAALWLLAKAHARVNDSCYHQLVSH